jgi:dTDP-4-amino-4,6-dideoxygalactose transaminase
MFYLRTGSLEERGKLLDHLRSEGVYAVFHYVPLHSAQAGSRFSRFHGDDRFTTRESETLVRLPIWYGMEPETADHIVRSVLSFYA